MALAFKGMELELEEEIGMWAGEVGNLVAMGLGDSLERTAFGSSEGSVTEMGVRAGNDPDERLGFADIVSVPNPLKSPRAEADGRF